MHIGSIAYSSVGIVVGGFAVAGILSVSFSLGAYLGLTVAGFATGVTSGAANLTHEVVKFRIVLKRCTKAKAKLEKQYKIFKKVIKQFHNKNHTPFDLHVLCVFGSCKPLYNNSKHICLIFSSPGPKVTLVTAFLSKWEYFVYIEIPFRLSPAPTFEAILKYERIDVIISYRFVNIE